MPKLETDARHGVMWTPPKHPTDPKPKATDDAMSPDGVDLTIPTERMSIFGLPQDTKAETQSPDNVAAWRQVFRDMAIDAINAERKKHEQ